MQSGLRLKIEVDGQVDRLQRLLTDHAHVSDIAASDGHVNCLWRSAREQLPQLHRDLVAADLPVISFAIEQENLEDIYMRISRHHTS
jgi:hypothetical protein